MMIQQTIFYIFAAIAVGSGLMVIASNNPVRSALFLVLAFFAAAGIWLLAEAEFLALVLILVYVGAVMTLFLFVVMMINIDVVELKSRFVKYVPVGIGIAGFMVLLMLIAISPQHFGFSHLLQPITHGADYSNVQELGSVLYTKFVFPFELAAVLLLVAIISAISLTHRAPRNCKTQNVVKQIQTKRDTQVRIVKMKSETTTL